MTSWNYDCVIGRKESLYGIRPTKAYYIQQPKKTQAEYEQEHREWLDGLVKEHGG